MLALCIFALAAGPAAAAPGTVPSDNSAAAQYTEALPGAEGDQTSKELRKKRAKKKAAEGGLSKKEARRLKALGKEGADAAELAGAGADGGAKGGTGRDGAAGGQGGGAPVAPDGSSAQGQILNTITGVDDGIGVLPPLLISLAVVAAALGYLAIRRRSQLP